MSSHTHPRIRILDTFGLRPFPSAVRECWTAIAGRGALPRSQWGVSSTRVFKPHISLPTWLGRVRDDRRIPIYNLFNRTWAPSDQGYSVKVTTARDFRGRALTYDSHVGTDFAVPVGTTVVAAAPGQVIKVFREMNRGGLKVCVDHGEGLVTMSCHLSRALVSEGDYVGRGAPLGLSGASGVEFVLFFPWVAPHLHFTVVLDGEPVDPFAAPGETSLWRLRGDRPRPHQGPSDSDYRPNQYSADGVAAAIAACRDSALRERLVATEPLARRGAEVLLARVFQTPLFTSFPALLTGAHPRRPHLDLPFRAADYDGIYFPDGD